MSKRNIGQEIIRGLEEIKAWKRGELKLKIHTIAMPKAADVPAIRKELGLSQPEFAGFMGVSIGTLRNWEQDRREPQGPARALLLVASKQPAAVRAAFAAAQPVSRKTSFKSGKNDLYRNCGQRRHSLTSWFFKKFRNSIFPDAKLKEIHRALEN